MIPIDNQTNQKFEGVPILHWFVSLNFELWWYLSNKKRYIRIKKKKTTDIKNKQKNDTMTCCHF